jgi:hypothetical protein
MTADDLKGRVNIAVSGFNLYAATHPQLSYDCRWLSAAKREVLRTPSPFSIGAFPERPK